MKSKILILVALLVTSISFSQRNPESTYMSTFEYKAKSGMVDKFEKAVAKKTKMFNTEEGSIIFTYRVLTGNNTGNYERYLVGQSSDSYDMDRSEELEYWEKNVAPYGDPVGGQVRWLQEQWASISDASAPKYLQKLVLRYKPGMEAHVSRFIYRWGKTWEKRNPNAWRRAFSVVSGGDLNLFVVFNITSELLTLFSLSKSLIKFNLFRKCNKILINTIKIVKNIEYLIFTIEEIPIVTNANKRVSS